MTEVLLVIQTTVSVVGFVVLIRAMRDIANIQRAIFMLLRKQYGEIDRELREIDQLVRARG